MSGSKRPLGDMKKKGSIRWDEENLEENERIKKELNPRKIDEPKTPYLSPMDTDEEGDLGTRLRPLSLDDAATAAAAAASAAAAEAAGASASAGTTSDEAGPSRSGRGRGRHVRIGGRGWSDSDRTVSPSPRHPDGGSPSKAARSPRFSDQYYDGLHEHDDEDEDEAAAADPLRQEKRRRFKEARKQHYNMREQLQRARELMQSVEDGEPEDVAAAAQQGQQQVQQAAAVGHQQQQQEQQQQRLPNGLSAAGAEMEGEHLDADVESEHEGSQRGRSAAGGRGGRGPAAAAAPPDRAAMSDD
ncbi:hypothetical protein CHLNCDRAFT_136100 [Chlorella variabilis]|uniref:Protein phosphatase inhibitor 2 n=1 Tax=Chlorella variabilis TaxID=554065 RepID=E1ZJR4_CHLVA|nr:hypothetical protein CHLNCDRAFT_136100 [Chlorella variabilis]EFN54038.1 hypothetical protein CHLNCDRAFT_136100 [Chlorella variabilis]|eukprot:XP_005846140.1 hypothetical protein CHLNCDRAFT_136100 [Chlorella variabilis]